MEFFLKFVIVTVCIVVVNLVWQSIHPCDLSSYFNGVASAVIALIGFELLN